MLRKTVLCLKLDNRELETDIREIVYNDIQGSNDIFYTIG